MIEQAALPDHLIPEYVRSDIDADYEFFASWVQGTYDACAAEYFDQEHSTRTHGNIKTYQAGCRGPLCSRGSREHFRQRTDGSPSNQYKWMDPIIEFFGERIDAFYREAQEALEYRVKNTTLYHATLEKLQQLEPEKTA